jgi:hypothetical protein
MIYNCKANVGIILKIFTFELMKILREHIVVKVPSIFIDETQYKGVDGKKIVLNVLYHPERHVRNFGIVTSVPDELLHYPLFNEHIGRPAYSTFSNYEPKWKTNADIELEIEVGDKVYFHHNCLLPDQQGGSQWNKLFLFSQKEKFEGKETLMYYFRVKYDLVFAVVRYTPANTISDAFDWNHEAFLKPFESNGKKLHIYTDKHGFDHLYEKDIIMIGSYVLIEPDFETWEDISIPIPETLNGKKLLNPDGSVRMKPKDQWLVTKTAPGEKYLRGWVRHVGSPLKGDSAVAEQGEYVYFQRFADTKIKIEGKDYFRVKQRHIIGRDLNLSQSNKYIYGTV